MKKIILPAIILVTVVSFAFVPQKRVLKGEGNIITTTPAVEPFTEIEIDFPLDANITVQEGSVPGIKLKGYENVLEHIKTSVKGKKLVIYWEPSNWWTLNGNTGVNAEIVLSQLAYLALEASTDAIVHGNVKGRRLKTSITGSGHITIDNLNVGEYVCDISGSGRIDLNGGTVPDARYDISGSGKIRAYQLQADEVTADVTGSGKCELTALKKLSIDVTGSGSVHYKGSPADVTTDITGSGHIAKAD